MVEQRESFGKYLHFSNEIWRQFNAWWLIARSPTTATRTQIVRFVLYSIYLIETQLDEPSPSLFDDLNLVSPWPSTERPG